jgi:hypothetical protein
MNSLTQSKNTIILPLLLALSLGCFGLLPQARAVCQQGCLINTQNTVLGNDALMSLTHGTGNTAIGNEALFMNTTGGGNTAIGAEALYDNTRGANNTATGGQALNENTTGLQNTANGLVALASNTTGSFNTGIGTAALVGNKTGSFNTAIGMEALFFNTTGSNNIALGIDAGSNLTAGSNNIDIFDKGVAGESNTIRIGTVGTQTNAYVAGISGATVPTGAAVIIDSSGHLGTTTSSARFKDQIKPMEKASEAILALKPVTFRYKQEFDPTGIPQFGLVAEEVAKVDQDLVARDEQGKPYTVRYEAVNAMLLNEFLKEHRKVEEQSSQIAKQNCKVQKLEATVVQLQSALKEQAAQIRKVSDQLSATEPAARLVD